MRVAKVVESVEATSPRFLYVDTLREDLDPHLDWLQPSFVDTDRNIRLSIHTFLIQTSKHTILIDTGIGNDKQNLEFANWNARQGSYLSDLAAAGCAAEAVDYVCCTHMHLDHTGWNTRLVDGRWMPTFPNARYLFDKSEWQHCLDHPGPATEAMRRISSA